MARKKAGRKRDKRGSYSGFDLAIGPSYKDGWSREEHPTPAPKQKCPNCGLTGYCNRWALFRQVNAFGNLIIKRRSIVECTNCLNEWLIETTEVKQAQPGKFNLRSLSPEQRRKLLEIVEREIKEGRIK